MLCPSQSKPPMLARHQVSRSLSPRRVHNLLRAAVAPSQLPNAGISAHGPEMMMACAREATHYTPLGREMRRNPDRNVTALSLGRPTAKNIQQPCPLSMQRTASVHVAFPSAVLGVSSTRMKRVTAPILRPSWSPAPPSQERQEPTAFPRSRPTDARARDVHPAVFQVFYVSNNRLKFVNKSSFRLPLHKRSVRGGLDAKMAQRWALGYVCRDVELRPWRRSDAHSCVQLEHTQGVAKGQGVF